MFGFEPSDEQKTLVESVRRFAGRELRPVAHHSDERGELPAALMEAAAPLGLLPASLPEAYGGFGERSAVTGALFAEELAWGDLSGALALLAPGLVALPVLLAGTEAQKHELLPAFEHGPPRGSLGLNAARGWLAAFTALGDDWKGLRATLTHDVPSVRRNVRRIPGFVARYAAILGKTK